MIQTPHFTLRMLLRNPRGLREPRDSVWQFYLPEFLRALRRVRAAETRAPADPTSASTTVGFSGESVHPV
jgi:hypothetical protein